jgi:hypothetical protein
MSSHLFEDGGHLGSIYVDTKRQDNWYPNWFDYYIGEADMLVYHDEHRFDFVYHHNLVAWGAILILSRLVHQQGTAEIDSFQEHVNLQQFTDIATRMRNNRDIWDKLVDKDSLTAVLEKIPVSPDRELKKVDSWGGPHR